MTIATVIVLASLAIVFTFQAVWTNGVSRLFRDRASARTADHMLPRVAVVLPLRGADPFLDRCLRGLLQQDYPQYDIRIIVDSVEDPAWSLVQRVLGEYDAGHVTVSALRDRRETCSLKMSSLIEAVADLDETYEVFAIVDADVIPHSTWLRDLVSPFTDPDVGATTGIRWFMPQEPNSGSLVRYVWNAAAVAQMHAFGIGFGGSLAVRACLFRDTNLLEQWSRILFEDTFTTSEVRALGHKLQFVPEATMVNRESIDLLACIRFISRQILNARLYHSSWPAIVTFAVFDTLSILGVVVLGAVAVITGDVTSGSLLSAGLATYALGMSALLFSEERHVRRLVWERGEPLTPWSWRLLWAGAMVHMVYPISMFMAIRAREVEWRGVTYRVYAPREVSLVEYRPYQPRFQELETPVSL